MANDQHTLFQVLYCIELTWTQWALMYLYPLYVQYSEMSSAVRVSVYGVGGRTPKMNELQVVRRVLEGECHTWNQLNIA